MKQKYNNFAVPALMLGMFMVILPLIGHGKNWIAFVLGKLGILGIMWNIPGFYHVDGVLFGPYIPYYVNFILTVIVIFIKQKVNPERNSKKDIIFKIIIILLARKTVMWTPLYIEYGINLAIPIILFALSFGLFKFLFRDKTVLVCLTTPLIPLAVGVLLGAVISPSWLSDAEIYWTFGLTIAFPLFFLKGISPEDYLSSGNVVADCFNIYYKGLLVMFGLAFVIPVVFVLLIAFIAFKMLTSEVKGPIISSPTLNGINFENEDGQIEYAHRNSPRFYQRLLS